MSEVQFSLFLSLGAWICALGAGFNLFRLKSRGNSALFLSAAFLAMGCLLWMIRIQAGQSLITLAGATLASLLVADVVVRSRGRDKQP